MTKRVLVVAGHAGSLINFRGELLTAMVARGYDVHAAAPDLSGDFETSKQLEALKVTCHDVGFDRAGTNPLRDFSGICGLIRLVRRLRPQAMLCYTIKPVVYGMLAGWIARVPRRFALITGLGYAFTGSASGKRRRVQQLARVFYRWALTRASHVFFQNGDDAALFRELGVLDTDAPVTIVNGSGVNLDHYALCGFPPPPIRFLLIARLLGDKGIHEFAAAAAQLRARNAPAEFHLVGATDQNPNAIAEDLVHQWVQGGKLTWHGALSDVRPAIAEAHVYVLPSYREGTPRTVLEAMSMGRPVITTDAPGCRETVRDGENGFLVPVRDADALRKAMARFVDQPDLIEAMGRRSRALAKEKYDVHKVNAEMLRVMDL
ncbi:MAG: glycosyltransferase family 4 protein [Pseudomonadota bacterium]